MRFSKDHKAATREKIVETAAKRFRQDGIDGVSVPALMKDIGLTHGGFYAHFPSKDALVTEAISAGMVQAVTMLATLVPADAADPIHGFVDAYCSAQHRDAPGSGCAIAALSGDVARHSPEVRAEMIAQVEAAIGRLAAVAEPLGDLDRNDVAAGTLAGVVGAIVLSRMCRDDAALSDRILSASRRLLTASPTPAA